MALSPNLRKRLQQSIDGVAQSGLPDRTFVRSQGCWNCIHAKDRKETASRWFDHREKKLDRAMAIALESSQGEKNPTVVQIRHAVTVVDQAIAAGNLVACDKGRQPNGQPVGDFIAAVYLCDQWTGRQGASLAAHSDGKPEILPEELREKLDGSEPIDAADLIGKLQGDQP